MIELSVHHERVVLMLQAMIFVQFSTILLLMWFNSRLSVDRKAYWTQVQALEIENSRLRVVADTHKQVIEEMTEDFKKGVIRDS